jgi:hypothetical protein
MVYSTIHWELLGKCRSISGIAVFSYTIVIPTMDRGAPGFSKRGNGAPYSPLT